MRKTNNNEEKEEQEAKDEEAENSNHVVPCYKLVKILTIISDIHITENCSR